MDLPFFKRGMELLASQLNRLSDNVRSSTITSVIGGRFSRTPGGTTLIIDAGNRTASAGDAGTCYYSVSDATIVEGTPIIEVSRELLPIQAGESGDPYRYPYGMTEVDAFKITIDSTFENWAGLYLKLEFNEDGLFRQYPQAARFRLSDRPLISGDQNQFILCSEISLSVNEQGKKYISNINNLCPLIAGMPLGSCHFGIEDSGDEYPDPNTVMVEVRVGKLNGITPMGMTFGKLGTDRFLIDLPATEGEWFAIYLVAALDNTGNISSAANALQFVAYNDYQKNTTNYSFILAAEVTCSYDGNGNRYASAVRSYCVPQFWNTIGQAQCPFLVYDSSKMVGQAKVNQVSVSRGLVDGMWPNGMGPDPTLDPVTLSVTQNCYVTLKMKYSTETYELLAPSGTPPDNENLVFEAHTTIPEPTVDTAHQLIAVVGFDAEKQKITDIYNQCIQPTANPCMLLMPS
jgi:hypothetical protein